MSRPDEIHDPYDRLCWLCSPVCLEGREEAREEAPPFRLLTELVRKTGRALSWMLGAVLSVLLLLAALAAISARVRSKPD